MAKIRSILFVCTGNSCRSVMAEALLKKALKESGKEGIMVSSAGVNTIDGISPTEETGNVLGREGIDASAHRSKSLTDSMILKADLILVMATHHKDDIVRRVPEAVSKTHILKQFGLDSKKAEREDPDILDPIGQPIGVYESVLSEIKKEIERIIELL